ncbi:MAG: WD40 repeat domain-containing protein [Acidimicrobiales bacterium]
MAIGLGVLALAGVASSLIALQAADSRSDEIHQLTDDLEAVRNEREELATKVERAASDSSVIESRWLAAVAISGNYSPAQSRLLAVEAATRSPTPESLAAVGSLLFADPRTKPPIVELEHDGPVLVTATAASSQVVATGSDDTTTKLWSTDGDLLATLAHSGKVTAVDFSADDRLVATGSRDGTAAAWTVAGETVASAAHTDQVNDVAISGDGALMVSGGHDGAAIVTNAETGETRHQLRHTDIVWTVALSDGGEVAATGGQDGQIRMWDLETGDEIAVYDIGQPVTALGFSPDGLWLFAGGQGGEAVLIDVNDGEAGQPLDGTFVGGVLDIDWHPEGTEMAVVSLGRINRYDLPTMALIAEHRVAGGARGVAYGPDGSWFVTGSGDFEFNFGAITFWETSTGTELVALNLGGPVESISVHPTGNVLAGFRTTEDLVEVGGARLVPGPNDWIALACAGTDGIISEQIWSELSGESASNETECL